jgi:hypothetical protein
MTRMDNGENLFEKKKREFSQSIMVFNRISLKRVNYLNRG